VVRALDIDKLKAFMCVVKWQSFTKAAAELFISQPALSKKISDFEKEIGTPLLVRDNRIIEMTPAGKLLYNEAPTFLKVGEDLMAKVQDLGKRPGSQLNVGCTGIEYGRLCRTINGFKLENPDISVVMHRTSAADIWHKLITGQLEIAFQSHFEVEQESGIDSILFCQDELDIVMSKNHPLAGEDVVSMKQLTEEVYIAIQPREGHFPFSYMINTLCQSGYNPRKIIVTDSVESLILQVSCGMGIAHLFRQTKVAYGGLVQYVPGKDPTMEIQVHMVWNSAISNPAVSRFVDYVRRQNETEGLVHLKSF
jgi:DNA-binding transcriptional LysR family regulator